MTHLAVSQLSGFKLTVPDNLLKFRLFVGVTTHYSSASKLGSFPPLSLSLPYLPLSLVGWRLALRHAMYYEYYATFAANERAIQSVRPLGPKQKAPRGLNTKKKWLAW